MIVEYMCTRTRSSVYINQIDMGGGGCCCSPPYIRRLEGPLKTEGWSTNIAAVQIGYNIFFNC